MSTPANIAKLNKDGTINVINVAMDGYPKQTGTGNVLLNAYQNPKKVDRLMKLGNLAHVGFTDKQANALKEAGENWTQYADKNLFEGKNRPSKNVSESEAKMNSKKEQQWASAVSHYSQAFQRDWGQGRNDRGHTTKLQSLAPSDALKAMKSNQVAPWSSKYNYLFDSNTNKWYMNSFDNPKPRSLKSAVPSRDYEELRHEYSRFQKDPANPKLKEQDKLKLDQLKEFSRSGLDNKYLEAHSALQKELGLKFTPQHELMTLDERTPTHEYVAKKVHGARKTLSDRIKDANHTPRYDYGKALSKNPVKGLISGEEALVNAKWNMKQISDHMTNNLNFDNKSKQLDREKLAKDNKIVKQINPESVYLAKDVDMLNPKETHIKPLGKKRIIAKIRENTESQLKPVSKLSSKAIDPNKAFDMNRHENLFIKYRNGIKTAHQDSLDDSEARKAVPHTASQFSSVDSAEVYDLKKRIFPKHAGAYKLFSQLSEQYSANEKNRNVKVHEQNTLKGLFPNDPKFNKTVHKQGHSKDWKTLKGVTKDVDRGKARQRTYSAKRQQSRNANKKKKQDFYINKFQENKKRSHNSHRRDRSGYER